MKATLYKKPDGRPVAIEIKNINQSDVEFFIENGINISLEEVVGKYGIWAMLGKDYINDVGDMEEFIYLADYDQDPHKIFAVVRKLCEKHMMEFNARSMEQS